MEGVKEIVIVTHIYMTKIEWEDDWLGAADMKMVRVHNEEK